MEARAAGARGPLASAPTWALGLIPLALVGLAVAALALLDGPGLGERPGPPVEELAIERTELRPGEIELAVRNDGPDAVEISQVVVNDAYVPFEASDGRRLGRLGSSTLTIPYEWIEGEGYVVALVTSTEARSSTRSPSPPRPPTPTPGSTG